MDSVTFWKNFNLGTELQLAGTFIYNGLQSLDQMENFYNEEDVFEFLYNISVGIERLEKVAVVLVEHDSVVDQELFEKSLITHNHHDLLNRIKVCHSLLALGSVQHEFMDLLTKFYKSYRYDRYFLAEVRSFDKEKKALEQFLMKYLGEKIKETGIQSEFIRNSQQIKCFMGKTVGKIVTKIYDVICDEARRANIYTYEIRYNSKAFKIFMRNEFDFSKESVLWKELLVFLMKRNDTPGIVKFIKEIDPLQFDPGLTSEYLQSFQNDLKKLEHLDELDSLYEEDVEKKSERLVRLDVIGNAGVMFDGKSDEDEYQPVV